MAREMAEYIELEAFDDAIRKAVKRYPSTFYNGLETARQIAHDFPAADVRPVVRGKWIVGEFGIVDLICSSCKEHEFRTSKPPFCPNCGADMREES